MFFYLQIAYLNQPNRDMTYYAVGKVEKECKEEIYRINQLAYERCLAHLLI